MKSPNHASLGDQISKKISAWILILVAAVIVVLFIVSFLLSRQMFNKQVKIWDTMVPQYALTNLIDSDHFSIDREIEFLKSTELFSSFVITDNQKRIISKFGKDHFSDSELTPIQDGAKVIWGYYYFKPNFYKFVSSFFVTAIIFLILVLLVYFVIRWRIRFGLESEFTRFNTFLTEIEAVTEKLHEIIHQENNGFLVEQNSTHNAEQVIINRAISKLINEIKKANESLREAISAAEQRRFQEELTRTALQVAHDIGSPLAGLEAIVQSTSLSLPEDSRISIRNAAGRIRDISNTLLKKAKHDLFSQDDPLTQQLLHSLIAQAVSEKRIEYGSRVNINFTDASSYGIFVFIRQTEFYRVLSNLINNAIEACDVGGNIVISLSDTENDAVIKVEDNGRGIRNDILKELGDLGKTHGKAKGLGIGLHHAINTIRTWDGKLNIQSKEGEGTTIQIYLPKTQPPSWFVPSLKISEGQTVVIIDDDKSIHDVWEKRFSQLQNKCSIKIFHFFSPEELIEWKGHNENEYVSLYLCDYEFIGSTMNGIDLIKKLKINYLSILVTSRITHDVTSICESHCIKVLPKDDSNIVLININ